MEIPGHLFIAIGTERKMLDGERHVGALVEQAFHLKLDVVAVRALKVGKHHDMNRGVLRAIVVATGEGVLLSRNWDDPLNGFCSFLFGLDQDFLAGMQKMG